MLPNLFIIGAGKCGTTSLHVYLGTHPEIFMSHPKELGYFIKDDWDTPERRAWYERHFADANGHRWRGESTPQYAQHPFRWRTAEKIHGLVPDARLLYIVRDPFERIVSGWYEQRSNGLVGPWDEWIASWRTAPYMDATKYATQLKLYLEYFDADQILVLDRHDLQTRRLDTLRHVFRWLEVDEDFMSPKFTEQHNTRRGKGTPRMPRWMWKKYVWPMTERVPRRLREPIAGPAKRLLLKELEKPTTIDPAVRTELEEVFQPEVDWLRRFSGLKFESWSL